MRADPGITQTPDPALLEQAAEWWMRLREATVDDMQHHAFLAWRQQSTQHAAAWARVERLGDLIDAIPRDLARPVLQRRRTVSRRTVVAGIATLGLLAPAGWLALRLHDNVPWDDTVRTAAGTRRRLVLPDGGHVHVDGHTVMDRHYGAHQRQLRLRRGRILVQTAPDIIMPPRPFRVTSTHGLLQALGTRFIVHAEDGHTRVTVLEGAVQVQPANPLAHPSRVDAGTTLRFTSQGCAPPAHAAPAADAWIHGMLAADAMRLQDVLVELARHHRGVLRCDPAVADLRVSGAYPLDDSTRSLQMLARTYPIALQRSAGGWWITVIPRSGDEQG